MKIRFLLPFLLFPFTLVALVATLFWAQCWAFMPEIDFFIGMFYKDCPAASEEARYPADIDILISSRYAPDHYLQTRATLLPGGQNIIYEPNDDYDSYRLYNLDTKQDTTYGFPESVDSIEAYLTDEWLVVGHYTKSQKPSSWTYSLLNRTTGTMIAMDSIYTEQYFARGIPADLQPLIQAHPIVYLTRGDLVLIPTYVGDPDATATFIQGYTDYPTSQAMGTIDANLRAIGVEPINLNKLNSPDQTLRITPPSYMTTPLGDLPNFATMTSDNTIVDVQSGETILTLSPDFFEPIGWAAGQRGVVLGSERRCTAWVPVFGCISDMPQPIVLQRHNPDYLTSTQQAAFAAQDAQEADAKHNALTPMGILLMVSGALSVATIVTLFYPLTRETAAAQNVAAV